MLQLELDDLKDDTVRENFRRLNDYLNRNDLLRGGWVKRSFQIDDTGAFEVFHSCGFRPNALVVLNSTGPGSVSFDFDAFTDRVITGTVSTGSVEFELLLGVY